MDSRFHKVVAVSEWPRGVVDLTYVLEHVLKKDRPRGIAESLMLLAQPGA